MIICKRCGKITQSDDVHTCSPQSPVPPHAAGEEIYDVPTSEAIDEALRWLRDAKPDYHTTLTRIISHLEASCDCPCPSPTASQAAPQSTERLRKILDALPRPLVITGHVQIIGAPDTLSRQHYTVGIWQGAEEALFMLQYMKEQEAR